MLNENKKSIWDSFTNVFSISKTLRFELRLVNDKGEIVESNEAVEALKDIIQKDKKIAKAYDALKLILDKLHEQVINTCLNSNAAKEIIFQEYLEKYTIADKKNELKKEIRKIKNPNEGELEEKESELKAINHKSEDIKYIEKGLRKKICETYSDGVESLITNKANNETGESNFKKFGVEKLFEKEILSYIERKIKELSKDIFKDLNSSELNKKIEEYTEGEDAHFNVFRGFFTYFGGYNENRKNYYDQEEKSTAIATRIVNVNLPKFCSNTVQFEKQKSKYENASEFLKERGKTTQIKDADSDKIIDADPIQKEIFFIENFSNCLSQGGIEGYNRTIGHYNLFINLYNQALGKGKDVKKEQLKPFKVLYKQIGCGEKKSLFDALKYDTIKEQKKKEPDTDKIYNLQESLMELLASGKKYFNFELASGNDKNLHSFIDWLEKNTDWEDIYWSKATLGKISNTYLENFKSIEEKIESIFQSKEKKDKEEKEKFNIIASYDKKRIEVFKFKDAVQLSVLFEILDEVKKEENTNWKNNFFKESILNDEEKSKVIDDNISPSENLIKLICFDLKKLSEDFLKPEVKIRKLIEKEEEKIKEKEKQKVEEIKAELEKLTNIKKAIKTPEDIIKITEIEKFKTEEIYISIVRQWLDAILGITRSIKYFNVPDGKIKKITGGSLNSELSNIIDSLLLPKIKKNAKDVKFTWNNSYDLVRNYLTKRPEDDAKKIKYN